MALSDHEIPTVYNTNYLVSGTLDTATSIIYEVLDCGEGELVEITYHIKNSDQGFNDLTNEFIIQDVDSSFDNSIVEMITSGLKTSVVDMAADLYHSDSYDDSKLIPTDLFLYDKLVEGVLSFKTHYRLNLGTIDVDRDMFVELTLAEAKYFNTQTDIFCVMSGTLYNIGGDIRYQSGTIHPVCTDLYAASLVTEHLVADIYSTQSGTVSVFTDVQQASGKCVYYTDDVYSSALATRAFGADFKTRSLFVGDFFLSVDAFTNASGVGYVDIVDFIYDVDESTIKVSMDETTLSGVFIEDIPKGKRVFFDPINDFYSTGEIILTVYAESVYGEVLEEHFYLLYGYDLKFNETGVYWGADNRIYVTATANNMAVCNNTEGAHYYFDTAQYPSLNLAANINAVQSRDLSCGIYPVSAAFYYGQTYTVKVTGVKDFHGNLMEPFTYTFTIESP
jgi:hypothetical protein